MEKPSVTIDLAPHLHDFIYNEFNTDRKMDGVLVNTVSDIGKMIEAMITISDRPPRVALKDSPIKLYLPIQNWNHRILAENFIFIPDWKQKQLQEYIEASYRIRIREYFVAGYEKGYKQDKIIRAFLFAYNIKNNDVNYDAIKKFDYRNRKKIIKQVDQDIQLSLFK